MKFEVMSDAGSIAIGTEDCHILADNGYGDGLTTVYVFGSDDEMKSVVGDRKWRLFTTVTGSRIEIPDYDCPSKKPWPVDGSVHDWTPVVTLDGRYGIYNDGGGTVALVRWGDAPEL